MFKKIFSIFRRSKFWKNATFDEVRVLYLAKMLRILAMNLSNGFVLMYIFKLGYGWNGVQQPDLFRPRMNPRRIHGEKRQRGGI